MITVYHVSGFIYKINKLKNVFLYNIPTIQIPQKEVLYRHSKETKQTQRKVKKVNDMARQYFTFESNNGDVYGEAFVDENNALKAEVDGGEVTLFHNWDEVSGEWTEDDYFMED